MLKASAKFIEQLTACETFAGFGEAEADEYRGAFESV
jgi:hypothetical protein